MTNSTKLDLEKDLRKLGLSENQSLIYLTLIKLGPITASRLSEDIKMKRSTTYLILDQLMGLGLVFSNRKGKKTFFASEKPDRLEKLTKRMRREVISAELVLEKMIPALKDIASTGSGGESKITHLEGINAVKNILLDIASSKASWYVFGSATKLLKKLSLKDLREALEEGEVNKHKASSPKIYFITDKDILDLKEFQKHLPERREIKIVPGEIGVSSAMILYDQKIAMFSFEKNPFVTVIEGKELHEMVKLMYMMVWRSIK
ncbi:MAG: hypothetical protein COT91_05285 [Candidatus Doudnabacteria bacterium CG10_big_fil_rev_8_21_14_0_10_41_10]|uniref:Transcription regulator TrmB N-terminal domain-containing protein n=1 Tax=Candidatus Doudnabacteria bacterium CG10_big_fil_rev_8_21_14_0_10_41_10 TaxID=1974551 RepID=A0A2H0VC00_9BACT|nr:MAG: hypothetical protein COT91_05285 [Candidatus Doudnabacteria bacterium CG10_big_fil_rev_8_21_14_0_10_41_10]